MKCLELILQFLVSFVDNKNLLIFYHKHNSKLNSKAVLDVILNGSNSGSFLYTDKI